MVLVGVTFGSERQVPTRYTAEGATYRQVRDSLARQGVGAGTFYMPHPTKDETLVLSEDQIDRPVLYVEVYYAVAARPAPTPVQQIPSIFRAQPVPSPFGAQPVPSPVGMQPQPVPSPFGMQPGPVQPNPVPSLFGVQPRPVQPGPVPSLFRVQPGPVPSLFRVQPGPTPSPGVTTESLTRYLEQAIQQGNTEGALRLIREGASVNGDDYTRFSPLLLAVERNNLPVVQALIQAGAQVDVNRNESYRPLWNIAAVHANDEIIDALLGMVRDLERFIPNDQNVHFIPYESPLEAAVKNNRLHMLERSLRAGFPVDQRNESGNTALHWTGYDNRPEMALLLLQYGADKTIRNRNGETAEELARRFEHPIVADLIQSYDSEHIKEPM